MEILEYKIEMLSDWHVGSGLDSATDADELVLKDDDNLPYIPGKTIKGLLKDAMMDLSEVGQCTKDEIDTIFGAMLNDQDSKSGIAFFSNACLPESEKKEVLNHNLSSFLYRNIASTAIGENGVAKNKSLRVMQVTIPLTLTGKITGLTSENVNKLKDAILLIRHFGVNRNRGLGRCKFST